MICAASGFTLPIRISTSKSRYFIYPDLPLYFYEGDDLAIYCLPMLAPNALTWWEEE